MQVANIADDSTFGLELEKIRGKIATLYESLLLQVYRAENPGASPEEIQAFIEENALNFPESQEDSEVDELLDMLDEMTVEDDLDPVEKDGETPKVEQGKEPKSKSHDKGEIPSSTVVDIQKGMLTSAPDVKVKPRTKDPVAQKGSLKRRKAESRTVKMGSLFDGVKDELASLKQRQRIGRKTMEDRL